MLSFLSCCLLLCLGIGKLKNAFPVVITVINVNDINMLRVKSEDFRILVRSSEKSLLNERPYEKCGFLPYGVTSFISDYIPKLLIFSLTLYRKNYRKTYRKGTGKPEKQK